MAVSNAIEARPKLFDVINPALPLIAMNGRTALDLRAPALQQSIAPDADPHHVQSRRRVGAVPAAVHHEAERAHDVHVLVEPLVSRQLARREQRIGEDDEDRPDPPDHLDRKFYLCTPTTEKYVTLPASRRSGARPAAMPYRASAHSLHGSKVKSM